MAIEITSGKRTKLNHSKFYNATNKIPINHKKTMEIINLTREPIEVTYRNGFKVLINSERQSYQGEEVVIIANTYVLPPTRQLSDTRVYHDFLANNNSTEPLAQISDAFNFSNQLNSNDDIKFGAYYHRANSVEILNGTRYNEFTTEIEIKKGIKTYVDTEDVLICFNINKNFTNNKHPLSLETYTIEKMREYFKSVNGVSINFEIVDNDNFVSHRYLNLTGDVYELVPVADKTRKNGVYVTVVDHHKKTNNEPVTYYTLEAAGEKIGLAKTIEEALTKGNSKELLELSILEAKEKIAEKEIELSRFKQESEFKITEQRRILAETEAELKKVKLETDIIKASYDKELTELKSKLESKTLLEKSEYDTRARERDDYYDSRSHSRKDTSELLKIVPAVISVVALGFAIFK